MCVTRKLEHVQTSTENFHGTLGGRLTLKQATSNLKYMFKVVLLQVMMCAGSHEINTFTMNFVSHNATLNVLYNFAKRSPKVSNTFSNWLLKLGLRK